MDENQMNQMNQMSQMSQINQMNQIDQMGTQFYDGQVPLGTPPKKKKTGIIITAVIFVILLALGAGVLVLFRYREQQEADASGEMVSNFLNNYSRLRLEKAYECFHPDVKDGVIEEQLDQYMVSGLKGMEKYLDLYFGGMELTYEVGESKRLSEEELDDLLSEIDDDYDADLDISKAYVYQITEIFSGDNGTLKIRENYFVGKEEDDWYLVAVSTDKVIKDDVDFEITDYLAEMIDDFTVLYTEAVNECDGGKMEDAYSLLHPEMRDIFSEELLELNSSKDMEEFVERRYDLYGGYSVEYEILDINYLEDAEWGDILTKIENYFKTEFDFHVRGVWAFDVEETASGNNGETVVRETFYMGEEEGEWYIMDILTTVVLSDTLTQPQTSQPVYADDEGAAFAEEAISHFIQAYAEYDIVEAYTAFHPEIRDIVLLYAYYSSDVGSADEYEEMLNDLFGDSLSITYTVSDTMRLSDEETEELLELAWSNFAENINISDAYFYLVEEYCEGSDTTIERYELFLVGKDGGRWFICDSIVIPEDIDLDDYLY